MKVIVLPYIAPKKSTAAKNRNTRQMKIKLEIEKQKNTLILMKSKPDYDDCLIDEVNIEDEIRNNGVLNRNIHSISKRRKGTIK